MSELVVTDISVKRDNLAHVNCGGAYRTARVQITVDSSRDIREQRISLAHEILGAFLGAVVDAETLTEMAEHIIDGLELIKDDENASG